MELFRVLILYNARYRVSGVRKELNMNGNRARWVYLGIVANLLLWMAVFAQEYGDVGAVSTKSLALIGFALAALSQHWSYHALWNVSRAPRID